MIVRRRQCERRLRAASPLLNQNLQSPLYNTSIVRSTLINWRASVEAHVERFPGVTGTCVCLPHCPRAPCVQLPLQRRNDKLRSAHTSVAQPCLLAADSSLYQAYSRCAHCKCMLTLSAAGNNRKVKKKKGRTSFVSAVARPSCYETPRTSGCWCIYVYIAPSKTHRLCAKGEQCYGTRYARVSRQQRGSACDVNHTAVLSACGKPLFSSCPLSLHADELLPKWLLSGKSVSE